MIVLLQETSGVVMS